MQLNNDQKISLLLELESLVRSLPAYPEFMANMTEAMDWLARARAAMDISSELLLAVEFKLDGETLTKLGTSDSICIGAHTRMKLNLKQAAYKLRFETSGPISVAVGEQRHFEYFDEIRRLIEGAVSDLLFIDPYLDADFIASYLPYAKAGVAVKLLTSDRKISTLTPAISQFVKQHGASIELRTNASLHDRYLIVDRSCCYQSGASFKDGPKNAATTITQVTDAFDAVLATYEAAWQSGTVV